MKARVIYADPKYIPSFYEALTAGARERVYIEMIEPPRLEKVTDFQSRLISRNGPVFYATDDEKVVGWCDVFPLENPRLSHRGGLGMGLLPPPTEVKELGRPCYRRSSTIHVLSD